MFRCILVPTDGSELSRRAAEQAVQFAKQVGARLVALSVAEPFPYAPMGEVGFVPDLVNYEQKMVEISRTAVTKVAEAAREAGVECEVEVTESFSPHEEIVRQAKRHACDLIFMASHGRRGLDRLFLGSETQKVLTHVAIPVLVYREESKS